MFNIKTTVPEPIGKASKELAARGYSEENPLVLKETLHLSRRWDFPGGLEFGYLDTDTVWPQDGTLAYAFTDDRGVRHTGTMVDTADYQNNSYTRLDFVDLISEKILSELPKTETTVPVEEEEALPW